MTLHHVLDCFPGSIEEACVETGVQYRDVPMDGKPHDSLLVNDSQGCFVGGITRAPDGVCGAVFNRKTGQSVIFFIREALPKIDIKQVKVKKSRKHLNPDVHHKFQVLKAILDDGVGQ